MFDFAQAKTFDNFLEKRRKALDLDTLNLSGPIQLVKTEMAGVSDSESSSAGPNKTLYANLPVNFQQHDDPTQADELLEALHFLRSKVKDLASQPSSIPNSPRKDLETQTESGDYVVGNDGRGDGGQMVAGLQRVWEEGEGGELNILAWFLKKLIF